MKQNFSFRMEDVVYKHCNISLSRLFIWQAIALYWLFFLEVFYFNCFKAFNYIIVVPKDTFTFFNLAFPVICFYSWYVFAKIFFNVQLKSCEDKFNHSSIGS